MSSEPIRIVGGGLGGLTTALALARRGWSARVLEGASDFGQGRLPRGTARTTGSSTGFLKASGPAARPAGSLWARANRFRHLRRRNSAQALTVGAGPGSGDPPNGGTRSTRSRDP